MLAGFFGTDELKPQAGPDLSREQPGEIAEQGRGEALEHAAGEGAVHIEEPRVGLADVEREAQPLVFTVGGGGNATPGHSIQLRIPSLSSSMRVRLTEATNSGLPSSVGRNSAARSDWSSCCAMSSRCWNSSSLR